jgi:serine/threonine protein kinase
VHLVTDLCEGGELFDRIVEMSAADNGAACFPEAEAAMILHQILEGIRYMHRHDVAHRDIKPENILFKDADGGGSASSKVEIIDFGLSRKHRAGEQPMSSIVGTPYYIAPEVLRKRYTKSCDLWSVGIISYIMLCGYPPFNGDSAEQTHKAVLRGRYCFPAEEWRDASPEAMDFVHRLLQYEPRSRMTAEQALNHPWMVKHSMMMRKGAGSSYGYGLCPGEEELIDNSSVEVVYRDVKNARPKKPGTAPVGIKHPASRSGGESPPRRKLRMSTFGL